MKNFKSTEENAQIGQHQDKYSEQLKTANDRFKAALPKHEEFVSKALKCEDFVFGEQWSKEDREKNEACGKPSLTINISLTTINAIYKEYSKLQSDITTKSTGREVHDESVLLNKVIRNVMQQNGHSELEQDFFLEGITTGRAWMSVFMSDEVDPLGAIQIKLEGYENIVLSPDAAEYDPESWPELFYFEEFTREEIEEKFGKAKSDMLDYSLSGDLEDYKYLTSLRTFAEGDVHEEQYGKSEYDKVIVVTREYYEYTDAYTFVDDLTTDYEVVPSHQFKNEAEATAVAKKNNLSLYKTRTKQIRYIQFVGSIALECDWLPSKYYSKTPFFAYFSKGRTMGVMDNVISPQEQLNKAESQELHIVNSTSNGGWQMEEDSLVNMTPQELESKGSKAGIVVVRRRGAKPLEKIFPNQVPTGISNLGNKASSHLMRVAGVNDAMVGITKTNDSGNLFEGKLDAGQGLLQRVFDNLRRSQKFLGRTVVWFIQTYYTEPRILRYTLVDGEQPEEVAINQVNAANRIVNDLSIGRYETVVTWMPKADVLSDAELDTMMRMREAGFNIPDWMIVDKSQLSNKSEMVAALRRQAGLDKTEEELQMEQMMHQINMKEKQLQLQELESKVKVNMTKAELQMAEAQDIAIGQNKRFLIETQSGIRSDELNAQLRSTLSQGSNETELVKTMLKNNENKQKSTTIEGEQDET